MSFISDLQKSRADYNNIAQARTQARSLNLLSSGIYTEEERFIYELLQNAIDSFQDTPGSLLKVDLRIESDYLVFSHNGKAFDQADIKGVCDVGGGSKERDSKKIGYKGIGFKSVFMASSEVHVCSGGYTFKFDKTDSVKCMPRHLGRMSSDDVPWQIIPIETCRPPVITSWVDAQVVICIKLKNTDLIVSRIKSLLSEVDFLLFLNAAHIEVTFTDLDGEQLIAEKETEDGLVHLSLDGALNSSWLLHSAVVPLEKDVREYIKQNPTSIPDKLKGQKETEVSFAIRVDDDEIIGLRNTVVYTYLPTSYASLDIPFIVNANFITDASRQQLQSDSVWNQNLFRHIPKLYLEWIGQISQDYRESYFNALPKLKSERGGLVGIFYTAFREAVKEVRFLPSIEDESCVLMASEAFVDVLDISDIMGRGVLVEHLNRKHGQSLHEYGKVSALVLHLAEDYGVFTFSWDGLESLFLDDIFYPTIDPRLNSDLLALFAKKYNESESSERSKIRSYLRDLECLMTTNESLVRIQDCSLPPNENVLDMPIDKMEIIHPELYALLKHTPTLSWLKDTFGFTELSKLRFVDLMLNRSYEVTENNAIEVGRLLFRINQEDAFLNDSQYKEQIQKLPFLTKQGALKPIVSLYLGGQYRPKHNVEAMAPEEDIYVSEEYVESWGDELSVQEWALFFKKCGVSDSVGLGIRILKAPEYRKINDVDTDAYPILKEAALLFRNIEHQWRGYMGIKNPVERIEFRFQYFTLISMESPHKQIDKFVFNEVLSNPIPARLSETIYGEVSYWSDVRKHPDAYIEHDFRNYISNEYKRYKSFFEYLISEFQKFPTSTGDPLPAEEVYLNNETIRNLAGNYLPVLDIDQPVHESWLKVLPFKKELYLEDLLEVLSFISQEQDKKLIQSNKERVETIYRKILEQDLHISGRDKLEAWGRTHLILSTKEGQYLPPSELSYITIQGFKPDRSVFLGKLAKDEPDKTVSFLKILRVKVVTEITPNIEEASLDDTLKNLLMFKLPYLALLKVSSSSSGGFERAMLMVEDSIKSLACYHCKTLSLSYGNKGDVVFKIAYFDSEARCFYYTGKLSSTRLDILASGLVGELKLSSYAQEVLTILNTETHEELVDYLQDKGYDTSLLSGYIEKEALPVMAMLPIIDTGLSYKERIDAQLEAQRILMATYPSWQFPEGYGTEDGNYLSVVRGIRDEHGNKIVVVLKSYRDQSKPLNMTAEECEALLNEGARLYLCVRDDDSLVIQEGDFMSLIDGQEKVCVSFDATNLTGMDVQKKVQKFVSLLRYFNGLHLAVEKFNTSSYIQRSSLYIRRVGGQAETTNDDL